MTFETFTKKNTKGTRKNRYPRKTWESSWQAGYKAALKYFETNAHLLVPALYIDPTGFPLGGWIRNRREKPHALTPHQIQALNIIGMVWRIRKLKTVYNTRCLASTRSPL